MVHAFGKLPTELISYSYTQHISGPAVLNDPLIHTWDFQPLLPLPQLHTAHPPIHVIISQILAI